MVVSKSKSFRITGSRELIAKLKRIERETPMALAAAMYQEAETILADSKENYVPKDMGTLSADDSSFVNKPEIKKGHVVVTMGFGGAAEAYALAVHETPSDHDPPSWVGKRVQFRVGGPKYLEKPVMAAQAELAAKLAATAEAYLRRQGI